MTIIQQGIIDTFEIDYEITMKNRDYFEYNMEKFRMKSKSYMILDLKKVSYLNNTAIGIIAKTALNASKNNKELVISGAKPSICEIFEIVKLSAFLKIFSTREEAVAYFLQK